VEVLVVDNGSTDDTRRCVAAAAATLGPVKYLREPRPGKSIALNTALGVATGEVLVFLDDDVHPDRGWLQETARPLADKRLDAVAGAVRIAPHLLRSWMQPEHLAWLASTHELDPVRPRSAVGANMAISARVLARVPGFDPRLGPGRLGLWEDTLFAAQLLSAGYRLGFVPTARVEHHFDPSRLSRGSFLAHAQRQGRSAAYVAWHWDQARSIPTSRFAFRYRLRRLAKRLLTRAGERADGIATWEMDLTCGIAFARQFQIERHQPRAYGEREAGLRPSFPVPSVP
jgi:GT2 family glycosyltransferase